MLTLSRPLPRRTRGPVRGTTRARFAILLASIVLVALCVLASLAIGSQRIPLHDVVTAFTAPDDSDATAIVRDLRVPRTELGLLVGAALGAAGALMQGTMRNPLAEPGILGINAGASFAVVIAIAALGVSSVTAYTGFALVGAGVAALAVFALGAAGRSGPDPVRLALAGAVLAWLLISLTSAVLVFDAETLDEYRFWVVGSIAGRDAGVALAVLPVAAAGLVIALVAGRSLNALALGDEVARSLGQRVDRTRGAGRRRVRAPRGRRGGGRGADRLRRARRAARGPRARRRRLPLDHPREHRARRGAAPRQRRGGPHRRAPGRARRGDHDGAPRGAVLHLARPPAQARGPLSAPRICLALIVATVAALVASVAIGEFAIAPLDVLAALVGAGNQATEFIVVDLRLPRALTGLLAGAALGLAGMVFQDVTRNPLVSPDIVGVAAGASLAAVALIVLGSTSGTASVPLAALAGALISGVALYGLAWQRGIHGYRLVLVGIGITALGQRRDLLRIHRGPDLRGRAARTCGSSARSTAVAGRRCGRSWRCSPCCSRSSSPSPATSTCCASATTSLPASACGSSAPGCCCSRLRPH